MSSIVFNLQQRAALEAITSDGTENFADGYRYLRQELQALTTADLAAMGVVQAEVDARVYWLTQAIEINENNLLDAANNFIRDITRYGLLWDGKPTGQVQLVSDAVGAAVIVGILDNQGLFLPIEEVVGHDVQAAISSGGQTIGGWGGAFYYWDAPFAPAGPSETVGSTISADPNELEKFIALASCTTFNALCRTVSDPMNLSNAPETISALMDMMLTGASAGVPLSIKVVIGERVAQYIAGTRQFFSDNPIHRDWQGTVDMSNASGQAGAGQNGFEINLITGLIQGIHSSKEDYETFFTIDNVKGSNLGDIITLDGTTAYIEVWGGGGDDRIYATGGTVEGWGGGGFDVFVVDANSYQVNITRNGQRLSFQATTGNSSYLLEDFDQIQFYDVSVSFQDLLDQIEQVINGTPEDDILHGTPGIDVINGLGGKDTMYGHEANDRLYGGANDDTFYGGIGSDAMFGDGENDIFHLGEAIAGDVDYVNGGAGTGDVVQLSVGAKFRLDAAGAAAIRGQVVVDGFAAPTGHGVGIEMGVGKGFVQAVETIKAAAEANDIQFSGYGDMQSTGVLTFDFTAGADDTAHIALGAANLTLDGFNGASRVVFTNTTSPTVLGVDVWNLTSATDTVTVKATHASASVVTINAGGLDVLKLTEFASPIEIGDGLLIAAAKLIANGFYRIETGAGDDVFHGSDRNSYFNGGAGTNTFYGSLGADLLISTGNIKVDYSASTKAVVLTSSGSSRWAFGANTDPLSFAAGDELRTSGWSEIWGSAHDDTLIVVGQYGTLHSNGGNDKLTGRDQNDTLIGANGYAEIMSPGDGNDVVDFGTGGGELNYASSTRAADIDMAVGSYLFGNQVDIISGVFTKLVGSNLNDTIRGTDQADTIDGGAGNSVDTIYGRGGDDTIKILRGTVHGGEGADTITSSYSAVIHGEDGDDIIAAGAYSVVYGGDNDDTISAKANSFVYGDDGEDTLTAAEADVVLVGGSGADAFFFSGQYPNSTLSYSTSHSAISLSTVGNQTHGYWADAEGDVVNGRFNLEGSSLGDDIRIDGFQYMTISTGDGDDYVEISQKTNVTIRGGAGEDDFVLKRGQTAYGDADDDTFLGVGTMNGGEGDDEFFLDLDYYLHTWAGSISGIPTWAGGIVNGGSGSNTIHGGEGDDTVFMLEGSDTFIFSTGGRKDTISGAGSDDVIRLAGVLAFSSMSDVSERLQQVGNNVLFDLGLMSDHDDVYGANAPDDFIGSIQFNGMTVAQVSALNWEFV